MAKKVRITLSQIMAILALLGIFLSVIGTAWIGTQPLPATSPLISGEQKISDTPLSATPPPPQK